jgi:O-antigen biosynthesis protein
MQIVIFGMHRSGTSSVARLLNMMGAYFAPEGAEMRAHKTNPKGFWERKDINDLCIRVLHSAKCDWHRLASFSIDKIPAAALKEFQDEARQIILGLDAHRPWFVKEPRLCVLAPLWLELLEVPICLFVHRSPLEVARSLEMRDGFPIPFGIALWERYMTAALNATRKLRRIQINHADLLADPVAVVRSLRKRLGSLGLRGLHSPSADEILAFIDPSLHRAKEEEVSDIVQIHGAQKKLWDAFESETALRSTKPFRFSSGSHEMLIRHDESIVMGRKAGQMEARNKALSTEITKLNESIAAARAQLARRDEELRLLKIAKENADKSAVTARQIRDTVIQGVESLRQAAKSDAELQLRKAEIANLVREQAISQRELKQREAELVRLRQGRVNSERELEQREAELARLRDGHVKSEREIARLRQSQVNSQREFEQREMEIAKLRQAQANSDKGLQQLEAELAKMRRELNTASARHASLNESLTAARVNLDELTLRNRVLKKGLDTIEGYFDRLRNSRSFHFMVYKARRIGLVSRTPRRCVEAIKDQFSAIRKATKQAKVSLPLQPTAAPAEDIPAAVQIAPAGHAITERGPVEIPITQEQSLTPPIDETQPVDAAILESPSPSNPAPAIEAAILVAETTLGMLPDWVRPCIDPERERRIVEAVAFRAASSVKHALILPPPIPEGDKSSVCFIILHRGGEQHLRNLFKSFREVNTLPGMHFNVVLHACFDGSREVIVSYQDRLNIKITEYDENHSFAYSNNRAAEQTSAEYLVFLNSDIKFEQDVTPELLRLLRDPRNGIIGVRLLFPQTDLKYPGCLQHGGVKFLPDQVRFFQRPWNIGVHIDIFDTPSVPEKFPAVTAALAACRRVDFLKLGGFCEDYFYGYEDVDLCLSFRRVLGLRSVSANHISSIHGESATGRLDSSEAIEQRRANNTAHLIRRHGWYLRRRSLVDKMSGNLFFSDRPLTVAFAVTEATPTTAAGDFFSASELGEACAKEFGWKTRYLSRKDDWYDLTEVDVLVVLLDRYELSKMRGAKPDLVKVAWLRNWFERWVSRPDFEAYDLFLCSSAKSAQWLQETQRKPAWVFPLATNPDRFSRGQLDSSLSSDYCFTGNNWQVEREIGSAVQPQKLEGYKFAVFGRDWDIHPSLSAYAQGFLPYSQMPNVYASTRIVLDDANHVTKNWGSVNSRVFDALAAGALVITNGEAGAAELFNGELPTYRSPGELQSLLTHYLGAEAERRELVDRLRQRVLSRDTYRHRARTLKTILIARARRSYRIAIKIAAPTRSEIERWGDYHFARSLGRCFTEQGHSFRIDCVDEWERPECFGDDVVIVLRGLSRYRPKPGQINLMWNINHPDKIQDDEYEEFDHVFVASRIHAADLARRLHKPVSALLQCTDPYLFYPDPNPAVPAEELLFVGNSRKQYREAVRFAVQAKMPIGVYGTFWSMFLPPDYIRGEYIDNSVLRQHYTRCTILLNDHWSSMRDRGFISNRLFDAAAAGAFMISDAVEDGVAVLGEDLVTYASEDDFRDQVEYYLSHPEERRRRAERLRSHVLSAHTFAHRAEVILERIAELDKWKRSAEGVTAATPPATVGSELPPDHSCTGKSHAAVGALPKLGKRKETGRQIVAPRSQSLATTPVQLASQPFTPSSLASWTASTKAAAVAFETCQLPPARRRDIERANLFSRRKWSPAVDIVVPIHNAFEEVKCCLESLVENTKDNYSIIAVNDGSDPALEQYLEAFSTIHPRCRIIHNDTPKGYTRAANQGLKASSGDYAILLNSDTVVASGWLEALIECGQSDPHIGVLGPLSNAASFQSVPERRTAEGDWAVNSLPVGFSVEDMARLVSRLSQREFPRVPFVNGFCYVIKRSVIETIGYLDEETFPQGYGEENDYSLRARDAGFELAVADQAFVFHSKSKSFGHDRRKELSRAGWEALKQKHGSHRLAEDLPSLEAHPGLTEIAGRIQRAISSGLFAGLLNGSDSTLEAPLKPTISAHVRPLLLADTSFRDEDYQRFLECCKDSGPVRETGAISVAAVILALEEKSAVGVSDTLRSLQRPNRNIEIHVIAARPEGIALETRQDVNITIHQADPSAPGKSIGAIAEVTTADFLIVLYARDHLGEQAFAHLDQIAVQPTPYRERLGALVFDDDVLDQGGCRTRPRLKPGWSPSRLLEDDYIGSAVWLNRAAVRQVGGFSSNYRFHFLLDLLFRLDEAGYLIDKQDVIDLHRSAASTDIVDPQEQEQLIKARTARIGGTLKEVEHLAHVARPRYQAGDALVSVVIPFRDRVDLLSQCVGSILAKTTFPNYEILLVNNQSGELETDTYLRSLATQSGVRIIRYDKPFNYSRLNNFAAQHARGSIFIFLNNDTEVISADWMDQLAGDVSQPGIGAVGAMLYFADGTIQHGGVVVGLNGLAGHLFSGLTDITIPPAYLHLRREVSAVTGACLAIRKNVFHEVGGFNERFRVTGNDVELGLRLRDYGYRNVMNPRVRLFHYEKSSRSHIPVDEADIELSLLYYQPYLDEGDPYFNCNLSRNVTYPTLANRETPRHVTFREQHRARRDNARGMRAPALRRPPSSNGARKLPDDEVIAYDVGSDILRENDSLMQRFYRFPYLDLNHVLWFVPQFDHLYRGGIFTIFRAAAYFSQRAGTRNTIVLYGKRQISSDQIESEVRQAFPGLRFELREYSPKQEINDLPESDAAFCTLWTSAYHLVRYNKCKAKFSFLQDYEPSFYAAGTLFGLTEETYRFGFIGIANTPGVAEVYGRYTPWVHYFVPAVDQSIYHPRPYNEDPGRPLRIVFYGRPTKPRNAFRLGIEALRRVKELYGDRVEIVSVGAEFTLADYELDGVIENRGVLGSIEEVADLYRNSDIGLVFMFSAHPSYQPFEFMASGCVTITNNNPLNHWLLKDGENAILTAPTVSCVTEKIAEALEDPDLRARISQGGLATVSRLDWAQAMETMYQYVRHPHIVQRNMLCTDRMLP